MASPVIELTVDSTPSPDGEGVFIRGISIDGVVRGFNTQDITNIMKLLEHRDEDGNLLNPINNPDSVNIVYNYYLSTYG